MVDAAMSFRSDRVDAASPIERESARAALDVSVVSAGDLAAYAELCAAGLFAPAQSAAWIAEWVANAAPDGMIAVASSGGRPVYALAVEVVKSGPFRIARLMSGRHANGNFPAADRAFLASGGIDFPAIFAAVHAARPGIDILALERLLPDLDGTPNPLLSLPHFASPNLSLAVDIAGGFDALLSRSSGKRKRKKHRSQTRKFEAVGG